MENSELNVDNLTIGDACYICKNSKAAFLSDELKLKAIEIVYTALNNGDITPNYLSKKDCINMAEYLINYIKSEKKKNARSN